MKNKNAQYYIDRRLKAPKYFFDWCFSQIPTIIWKNKSKTITSNRSGYHQISKKLTTRSNLNFFDKYYLFVIVLVSKNRIEIQSYIFWSRYIDGIQNIEYELCNFELFENNQHIQVTKSGYTDNYTFGLTRIYSYCSGFYTGAILFNNNFQEKIKSISELKYIQFDGVLHFQDIANIYKYKSEIEFLQKINAKKLANEVMFPKFIVQNNKLIKTVDMHVINRNWLKKHKSFLKNSDKGFMSYEFERRIKERNGTVIPGIEEYLSYKDIKSIPKEVGIIKFQNWIIKNKIDFEYYKDYLAVLKDLNIDLNENLICPKCLKKAHDEAVKLLNKLKRENNEKKYENRLSKILKLEREFDGYIFLVPRKVNEIIKEGKALHHCVGSSKYIEDHIEGKTTIIFVRKKDHKNKSLYTLEFRNQKIIQFRGKHNQNVPENVTKIANKWLKAVTKGADHGA